MFVQANKLAEAAQLKEAHKVLPASLLSPRGRKKGTKDSKRKSREVSPQKESPSSTQRSKKSPTLLSYAQDHLRDETGRAANYPDRSHFDKVRQQDQDIRKKISDMATEMTSGDQRKIAAFMSELDKVGDELESACDAINQGNKLADQYDTLLQSHTDLQLQNASLREENFELKMATVKPR